MLFARDAFIIALRKTAWRKKLCEQRSGGGHLRNSAVSANAAKFYRNPLSPQPAQSIYE